MICGTWSKNDTLDGEGQWNLAWIGASCHQITGADGKTQIPAWVWLADNSAVLDGYTNLDFGVDPSTCQAGQSLNLGGTAYNGKWRAGSGTDRLGEHLDDILLSSPQLDTSLSRMPPSPPPLLIRHSLTQAMPSAPRTLTLMPRRPLPK